MNTKSLLKILLSLSFFVGAKSFSQDLTTKQLFLRCYSQLTRMSISLKAGRVANIKDNDPPSTAVNLCMAILDTGSFDGDGNPVDSSGKQVVNFSLLNAEYLSVLRTFQQLHQSFFLFQDFQSVYAPGVALSGDVYDSETPAYYFTKALFQNRPLSWVLTTNDSLRANRRDTTKDQFYGNDPIKGPQTNIEKGAVSFGKKLKFAPRGELIGIAKITAANKIELGNPGDQNRELTAHRGGGILGSTPYLFSVQSRKTPINPDQGLARHRGFSKSVMNDFLCREFPVVEESDVQAKKNSSLAFEQSPACYKCHASMDPLADVVRNITYELIPTAAEKSCVGSDGKQADCKKLQFVSQFNQNNQGTLYYRDTANILRKFDIVGIDGLGTALSNQYDFYLCTAKRYYNYFMGVDIKLYPGLIKNSAPDPKLTDLEKRHVKNIIDLASYLKDGVKDSKGNTVTGNLKGLVRRILELPEYRKSDFGIQ